MCKKEAWAAGARSAAADPLEQQHSSLLPPFQRGDLGSGAPQPTIRNGSGESPQVTRLNDDRDGYLCVMRTCGFVVVSWCSHELHCYPFSLGSVQQSSRLNTPLIVAPWLEELPPPFTCCCGFFVAPDSRRAALFFAGPVVSTPFDDLITICTIGKSVKHAPHHFNIASRWTFCRPPLPCRSLFAFKKNPLISTV